MSQQTPGYFAGNKPGLFLTTLVAVAAAGIPSLTNATAG